MINFVFIHQTILITCLIIPPWIQFEYQQAQLEREIENLSWKVERAETTTIAVSTYLYRSFFYFLL